MKVGIITCIFERTDVVRIWLKCFSDLRDNLKDTVEIVLIVAGGPDEETRSELIDSGCIYIDHENRPLSNKFNATAQKCRDLDCDYMIVTGSDNVFNSALMITLIGCMKRGIDYTGYLDSFQYQLSTGKALYIPAYRSKQRNKEPKGAYRMLSKSLLKRLNWQPWEDGIDSSLDWSMTQKIRGIRQVKDHLLSMQSGTECGLGLKSGQDKNKFGSGGGRGANAEMLLKKFPTELVTIIKEYGSKA